jgi:diadenosine tetraphosphate (Ap4A) HIT family hydrolase
VGRAAARLARALIDAGDAEWVYSAVIGTGVPHFHLHLLPRYPGTPREVAWHAVDEWEGGPHGGADEIADFAKRLKPLLQPLP